MIQCDHDKEDSATFLEFMAGDCYMCKCGAIIDFCHISNYGGPPFTPMTPTALRTAFDIHKASAVEEVLSKIAAVVR